MTRPYGGCDSMTTRRSYRLERKKTVVIAHKETTSRQMCRHAEVRTRASCCLRSRGATARCRQTQPSSARDKTIRSSSEEKEEYEPGSWELNPAKVPISGNSEGTYAVRKFPSGMPNVPYRVKTLRCWFMFAKGTNNE